MQLGFPELCDLRIKVIYIDDETVPATWLGFAAVRHGLRRSSWSKRCAQHKLQVAPGKHRKIGRCLLLDLKPEILRVKLDRWIEFVDHIPHSHGCHIPSLVRSWVL